MTRVSHSSLTAHDVVKGRDHSKIRVWSAMESGSGIARTADYLLSSVLSAERASKGCGWDVGNVGMVAISLVCDPFIVSPSVPPIHASLGRAVCLQIRTNHS